MGGAEQRFAVAVEELAGKPVQLHRHVGAAIEVGVNLAAVAHHECTGFFPAGDHIETQASASLSQLRCRAKRNQRFGISHPCN